MTRYAPPTGFSPIAKTSVDSAVIKPGVSFCCMVLLPFFRLCFRAVRLLVRVVTTCKQGAARSALRLVVGFPYSVSDEMNRISAEQNHPDQNHMELHGIARFDSDLTRTKWIGSNRNRVESQDRTCRAVASMLFPMWHLSSPPLKLVVFSLRLRVPSG